MSRRRESVPDRQRGRPVPIAASAEELDELRRHNQQVEEQNQELRQRIEELTSDHEDRAATLEINDSLEQFKTYLGLKLKEDFRGLQRHQPRSTPTKSFAGMRMKSWAGSIAVLQAEGVQFEK